MYNDLKKIAVIDTGGSARGFAALGLKVFPAENGQQAAEILQKLAKEDYAVIYLAEHLAQDIPEVIAPYKEQLSPAIILIPGSEGGKGIGMKELQSSVEKAVGANIL